MFLMFGSRWRFPGEFDISAFAFFRLAPRLWAAIGIKTATIFARKTSDDKE